jgi:protease I
MANELQGKKIAFLATDGVEQVELTTPWNAVKEAGAQPELISIKSGRIQAMNGDINKADTFQVDKAVPQALAQDYAGLVLPGGTCNPDRLRMNGDAMQFVRDFSQAGKPIGAICHGPWSLVETGIVKGRTVTSYPSLQTDIRNAGGMWVNKEVHIDNDMVTSRMPDDLPAFCRAIIEAFREGPPRPQWQATDEPQASHTH